MKSLRAMIEQLSGLIGTKDVTAWEDGFLRNAVNFVRPGSQTTAMSPKQVETVERIYKKNFGDNDG